MPKTYYEVRLKGSPELIKAFTIGFIEGRGGKEEEFVENACRIEEDSPISLVLHFFSGLHHETALVMESSASRPLIEALHKHRGAIPVEVSRVREITGAAFDFRYRTNSHETGKELLALFSNLTGDLKIEGYAPKEENIPEAKGIEAYAPLHDYELKAKGTVTGEIHAVHDLYCRAGRFEVVDLGDLRLVYGKTISS